ncbi:hypothetical protein, variant [Exophiala sideris]|uniref:Uncharacterized protein n=1 Tax=Exophiala sideris TaxID=1016849 RepID=A0A0D1YV22_9EURO|nr:hypothetical protein PV11_01082 [Exophiala sideris]KIV85384.1 hypothetical protein, variant [Exophiala sideris]
MPAPLLYGDTCLRLLTVRAPELCFPGPIGQWSFSTQDQKPSCYRAHTPQLRAALHVVVHYRRWDGSDEWVFFLYDTWHERPRARVGVVFCVMICMHACLGLLSRTEIVIREPSLESLQIPTLGSSEGLELLQTAEVLLIIDPYYLGTKGRT